MPRTYVRKTVAADSKLMENAVNAVKNGMIIHTAANVDGVSKTSLWSHMHGTGSVGRPRTYSNEEEAITSDTLQQM